MTTTRDRIVDNAALLIWKQGYTRTTVDEIIAAAGICKGSFYHYFASKDSLGLAVIDAWAEAFGAEIQARLSAEREAVGNIEAILDTTVETQRANGHMGCPLGRMALEMADLSDQFRRRIDGAFHQWTGLFERYLVEAGMCPAEARASASYTLATLEGALLLNKVSGGGQVLEQLIDQMKSVLRRQLTEVAA